MDAVSGRKMTTSKTTRTHLVYQFIILTLLLLSIGYNELLPDRKFLIFLTFLPILCYQLLILSCCMELMPVPSWMDFFLFSKKCEGNSDNFEKDVSLANEKSLTEIQRIAVFPEIDEVPSYSRRRWEKSVTNLGATPKYFANPKKSKSWMNLSDSRSSERLSREGSLDSISSSTGRKYSSKVVLRQDNNSKRKERVAKAKSWKPGILDFDISSENEMNNYKELPVKHQTEAPLPANSAEVTQEESELSKSYSFPFRQRRLETWLEMKETRKSEMNRSSGMPYWQTVGYNLAVKYEARRRQRASANPLKTDASNDHCQDLQKSPEVVHESSLDRSNSNLKKSVKSASACMNKLKLGFSNFISKKKEDGLESNNVTMNKVSRSNLFKLKNKSVPCPTKEKEKLVGMPEFPQFMGNDRPLIFYPKYIPFERDRFETDVKNKMVELAEENKGNLHIMR